MEGKFSILYPSGGERLIVYMGQNSDDECITQREA